MNVLRDWFHRYFSDPQVVSLVIVLIICFTVILLMGSHLAPVLTAIVVAYLLLGLTKPLERVGVPNSISLLIVYAFFITLMIIFLAYVIPELIRQINGFFSVNFGKLVLQLSDTLKEFLQEVSKRFPGFGEKDISKVFREISANSATYGKEVVQSVFSVGAFNTAFQAAVFIFMMPFLVFFFLKDKDQILAWMKSYYPKNIELTNTVWKELDEQIANYIRGKVFEILLVWVATYIAFLLFDMPAPLLLAAMVGFSVLIPYVGMIVVTIPIVLIAYFTYQDAGSLTVNFWWVIGSYAVIQAIDGIVIVPLLFSEVVKLHPIAIVIAVLFFGAIWGFWGVFFAIPLASLVQAVLRAWPRAKPIMTASAEKE